MNPSSLLYVPGELLREQASHVSAALPMGGSRERLWAGLACGTFVMLSIGLILVLH